MARAAGIIISWEDMDKLSRVTPLLAKVYPNGSADINHFHAAGGTGALFTELLSNGLMQHGMQIAMDTKLTQAVPTGHGAIG